MLVRLGRFAVDHRRAVLASSAVALIVAGVLGGSAASYLTTGGFEDPNSESRDAVRLLGREFNTGEPNVVLLVTAHSGSVDDPEVVREGAVLTERLAHQPGIAEAFSYWTLGMPPPLRSVIGDQALVLGRLEGDDDEVREHIEEIAPRFTMESSTVDVAVGGRAEVFRQVGTQIEEDLRRAEVITFPIVLVLLVLVFGSVVAAGLPVGVGALSVVGAFLVLRVLALFTDVSIFSLNLATGMGLGLGIDYSLFIVSRFREELRNGLDTAGAVVRTVETAGRTVAFSALTVAASLAALLVFPLSFLRSFAYAGVAVVSIACFGALVALPALLAVLGPRVDKWVLWHRPPKDVGEGFWHRIASLVMRRPIIVATVVTAFLLLLGAPFLNVSFGVPDDRVLPESASTRAVHDALRTNFLAQEANAVSVVSPDATGASRQELNAYASALSSLEGVARVDAASGFYAGGDKIGPPGPTSTRFRGEEGTWLSVVPSVEPISNEAEQLVKDIRAEPAPFSVKVGGVSADLVDSKESIFSRVPLAAGIIAVVTFVVLFLMTGSLLVPVKATILNLLSLTATFGAMVWIFQEGHLADFFGFTPTGTLDTTTPILMFCVAFGLSMDYEVFLLSRIKEEHDRTGDNVASVAVGLERTGRIVTAAAALLAVVFIAFVTSKVTFIKLLGVGMTLAVLMDATLIRGTLVPAFMRLAGEANWWAPRPLKRFYERFGLRESETPAPAPVASEARS